MLDHSVWWLGSCILWYSYSSSFKWLPTHLLDATASVCCLQESFQSGSSAAQQGSMEAARQHAAVVSAALGTLGGFVEWAPMGRLCAGSVVEACSFFLGVPDFRDAALAVVKQVGAVQQH
jgi:hypothetical protein